MAEAGAGNSLPASAVPAAADLPAGTGSIAGSVPGKFAPRPPPRVTPTPTLLSANLSQLVAMLCLSPASSGGRRHPFPLHATASPQSKFANSQQKSQQAAAALGWAASAGDTRETATSRWQWLLVPWGQSTALELGKGLVSPGRLSRLHARSTHSIAGF